MKNWRHFLQADLLDNQGRVVYNLRPTIDYQSSYPSYPNQEGLIEEININYYHRYFYQHLCLYRSFLQRWGGE